MLSLRTYFSRYSPTTRSHLPIRILSVGAKKPLLHSAPIGNKKTLHPPIFMPLKPFIYVQGEYKLSEDFAKQYFHKY
jgi:hypothetical protein